MESNTDMQLDKELQKVKWTTSKLLHQRLTFKKTTFSLVPAAFVRCQSNIHSTNLTDAQRSERIVHRHYNNIHRHRAQYTFKERPSHHRHILKLIEVVGPQRTNNVGDGTQPDTAPVQSENIVDLTQEEHSENIM